MVVVWGVWGGGYSINYRFLQIITHTTHIHTQPFYISNTWPGLVGASTSPTIHYSCRSTRQIRGQCVDICSDTKLRYLPPPQIPICSFRYSFVVSVLFSFSFPTAACFVLHLLLLLSSPLLLIMILNNWITTTCLLFVAGVLLPKLKSKFCKYTLEALWVVSWAFVQRFIIYCVLL